MVIEERIVALCERHVEALARAEPKTLAAVRRLFREEPGRRSLLPRRSPLDRRVFPARPEGRRMGDGRRSSDVVE